MSLDYTNGNQGFTVTDVCPKCKMANIVKGLTRWICRECNHCFSEPIQLEHKYQSTAMNIISHDLKKFREMNKNELFRTTCKMPDELKINC